MLAIGCAVVAVEAWFPLGPKRSTVQRDTPAIAEDTVTFEGRSVLESAVAPRWLAAAIDSGALAVEVSFNASSADQSGPARLWSITDDVRHANMMVGQDGDDLVVRIRRPGSDPSGDPGFVVPDVVQAGTWQTLSLDIADGGMRVDLDGRRVIDESLSATDSVPTLSSWDPTYRLALGDELDGDREWSGSIRVATVTTVDGTTDLLAPGVLQPGTEAIVIERDRTILRPPDSSPVSAALRLLIFLPIGAAVGRLVERRWLIVTVAIAAPLALAFGKTFVAGRHPGAIEVVIGAAGIIIGAMMGRKSARLQRPVE